MQQGNGTSRRTYTPNHSRSIELNALVQQAKAGSETGWRLLVEKTRQRIYYLCLKMWKGNIADAEDSTQDTYLRIVMKLDTYRGDASFDTWVHRIAVNAVLMQLRRRIPETIPLESLDTETGHRNGPSAYIGVSDRYVETFIFRRFIGSIMDQLPETHQQTLLLHDFMGHPHKEIAEILDCTIGASKGRAIRARHRILELIAESRGLKVIKGEQTSTELIEMLEPYVEKIFS